MKEKYQIISHTTPPNGEGILYLHQEQVNYKLNLFSKKRRFTLLGSSRHTLNGDVPKNYSKFMVEMGNLIYPIELKVDEHHQLSVLNHEDIVRQWREGTQRLQILYKQDPEVVNYINKSAKNIYKEDQFLKSLQTNSFVQMFLMPEGKKEQMVNIYNIAPQVKVLSKTLLLNALDQQRRYRHFYKDEQLEATLITDYDAEGMLYESFLKCVYEVANEGYYTKEIKIYQIK